MSASPAPATAAAEQRRKLRFANEDDAIAEIDRLRAGGYRKTGNWSLPMICFHLGAGGIPRPPATTTPTPEQAAMKKGLIDVILQTGKPPPGFQAPPGMVALETCPEDTIDRFREALVALKSFPHSHVDVGPFGPVPVEQWRKLTLMHSAHHLSFLQPLTEPAARRQGLRFDSDEDVIADVDRLRRGGHAQVGAWSLPQVCWHLARTTEMRMKRGPFPADTPEQTARRPVLEKTLASGQLPDGIVAPPEFTPPADPGEQAIDEFIATLRRLSAWTEPIAPHRLFGRLDDADARRLNRIHCARHLSFLVPTAG